MAPTVNYILRINSPQGSRIYRLPPGETMIGSSPSADVFLPDARVSWMHAQIDLAGETILLTDLNSTSGTYVSDVRRGQAATIASEMDDPWKAFPGVPVVLEPGDHFLVGLTELILDIQDMPWRQIEPTSAVAAPEPFLVRPSLYAGVIPPGLTNRSLRLIDFLPEIYRSGATSVAFQRDTMAALSPVDDFFERFLALFESVLLPIEWLVDNFDLYLDPHTAPVEFLPWLESWYGLDFAATLDEARRRNLLGNAHRLFRLKGTRTALVEAIELVTGCDVEIDDLTTKGANFIVTVRCGDGNPPDRVLMEQLIDVFKPIHTTHQLIVAASTRAVSEQRQPGF